MLPYQRGICNDEWEDNNELRQMWKKAVMTYFKVPSQHFPGETEEHHEKCFRITSLWTETDDFQNTKQEC
jgi:hypothetical protein